MKKEMPLVPLTGITVMPNTKVHFDIVNLSSMKAIEMAMKQENQYIFISTQKNDKFIENIPKIKDLNCVGTIAQINQIMKTSNAFRILVDGICRASIDTVKFETPYIQVEVSENETIGINELQDCEIQAYIKLLKEILEIYFFQNQKLGKEILEQLLIINDLEVLVDMITAYIQIDTKLKQEILEELDIKLRTEKLISYIKSEIEVLKVYREIQARTKQKVDKNQREYILREQIKVIRKELGDEDIDSDADEYLNKVEKLNADSYVKDKLKKEIKRFKSVSYNSPESTILRGYIESLLELPWNESSEDNDDIKSAIKILESEHYGLKKVKERIIEFLAVRSINKKGDSPIICLVGPPGTGKTSIAKSIAKALNKKYVRISLGGVRDEAEIRGHRKTYVGAMMGRIANGIKQAGVKNPLMLLDEIDKISQDKFKGDTSSALLEVLDSEQNSKFRDHYLEVPIDLSEVLFVATANDIHTIPKPLLDRMEVIEVSSYTENEKLHIAKEYLVSKQISKNGLKESQISFSDKALIKIIRNYTREAGVRSLERQIGKVCRKVVRQILEDKNENIKITENIVKKYLGSEIFTVENADLKDEIGIVRGLAWTSVGGDTLSIEVNVMPGKGSFKFTGKLGDVMKESAETGVSYIRSISKKYNISKDFFSKNDIHVHIPEGAVPKDGPSAGITMATAMLSAITKIPVRGDIAMTGEITLRGKVLPIGGLKEKLLAGKIIGIKTFLVPKKNEKDVKNIDKEITDEIEIIYVDDMQKVLKIALKH